MIRYFCDKCGKELDSFNGTISSDTFKVTIEPPEIRRWADDAETGTYILCYDCVRKFNKWVGDWKNDFVKSPPVINPETLNIPDACKTCRQHPSNGGNGICHCTLGTPEIT